MYKALLNVKVRMSPEFRPNVGIYLKAPLQWLVMTLTEIVAGVLLIAGLLNSLAAAAVVGTMVVAFWTVHRSAGFFITAFMKEGIDVEGWEYVFTLAFAASALAIAGPGDWSLDYHLEIDHVLDSACLGACVRTASSASSVPRRPSRKTTASRSSA